MKVESKSAADGLIGADDNKSVVERADAAAAEDDRVGLVRLSRPLSAYGKEVTELVLREPLGGDITTNGFPVKWIRGARQIDARIMGRFIDDLANLPCGSSDKLAASDWLSACQIIAQYFDSEADLLVFPTLY